MKIVSMAARIIGALLVVVAFFLAVYFPRKLEDFPTGLFAFYISVGVLLLIAALISVGASLFVYNLED